VRAAAAHPRVPAAAAASRLGELWARKEAAKRCPRRGERRRGVSGVAPGPGGPSGDVRAVHGAGREAERGAARGFTTRCCWLVLVRVLCRQHLFIFVFIRQSSRETPPTVCLQCKVLSRTSTTTLLRPFPADFGGESWFCAPGSRPGLAVPHTAGRARGTCRWGADELEKQNGPGAAAASEAGCGQRAGTGLEARAWGR